MPGNRTNGRFTIVALAGQFCHAVYQVAVASLAPGALYGPLAAVGLGLGFAGLWYSLRRAPHGSTHSEVTRATDQPTDSDGSSIGGFDGVTRPESVDESGASPDPRSTSTQDPGAEEASVEAAPPEPASRVALTTDGGLKQTDDGSTSVQSDVLARHAETVDRVAEGDLTVQFDAGDASEDVTRIAEAFDEMVTAFDRTIDTAGEFSTDVAGSSQQVTTAIEAVREASEHVAEDVQKIADVFTEQHRDISQISDEMSDMSAMVEEIAASTDQVTEMAEKTERQTVQGIESGREAHDAMTETTNQTDAVVETVERLNEQMNEVGQIVDLIDDIAEQTNILALNASIEAAHASSGAENTGFGVVADEVKTLAEETKDATNEIESLIGEIQSQTDETVDEIRDMRDSVDHGRETVDDSLDSLETIMDHVQQTTTGIKEISNATDEQAATAQEVASIADQTARTSRENVEEAEQLGAIAEEQNLALGEMYVNAKALTMRADQLSSLFERYETSE